MKNERKLTNQFYINLNQNRPYGLKKLNKFLNLATKDFEGIWSGWYKGETPPKLEVDLITTFEDTAKKIDDALIIASEMKFFKDFKKRGFYEGIEKPLAYSLFGFDGLSLWHLFSKEMEDEKVKNFASASEDLIKDFNLPIFYICGKIIGEDNLKIKSFVPLRDIEGDAKYFAAYMRNYTREKRNPLLFENKYPNFERLFLFLSQNLSK